MGILEKEVWIGISGNNVNHYESLGYTIPKYKPKKGRLRIKKGTKLLVKVDDLTNGSSVKVTKICDGCGEYIPNIRYVSILNNRKLGDGLDRCIKCYNKKSGETRHINYIEKNGCIADNNPEFAKLLWNEKDAYSNTYNSDNRVDFRCPKCNCKIKNKVLSSIYNSGLPCPRCSDGKSYPEKFVTELFCQLNIDFEAQRKFKWSKNKIYDFYIKSLNCIIETHGKQHYIGGFEKYGENGRDAIEEQENDRLKENLATENHIHNYITIDCSESNLNYIKSNVLKSKINDLFNLSKINWVKCHEYACGTLVKIACDMWNSGYGTTGEIGKVLNLNCNTVAKYLKQGVEIGWCDYNPIESKRMTSKNSRKITKHVIQLSKYGIFISGYESISKASDITTVSRSNISQVCAGRQKTAGGYKWMYKEDYDKYIEQVNLYKHKEELNEQN